MFRRPLYRARHPRTRRLIGGFVVVGVLTPLSALAWRASAADPPARCEALFDTIEVEPDATVTIVRDGNNITVPDCTGTGPVLGTISDTKRITITGGGESPTVVIDLSKGNFPASVKFDIDVGLGNRDRQRQPADRGHVGRRRDHRRHPRHRHEQRRRHQRRERLRPGLRRLALGGRGVPDRRGRGRRLPQRRRELRHRRTVGDPRRPRRRLGSEHPRLLPGGRPGQRQPVPGQRHRSEVGEELHPPPRLAVHRRADRRPRQLHRRRRRRRRHLRRSGRQRHRERPRQPRPSPSATATT